MLNAHNRTPTQYMPTIINEKNFCQMMKDEFSCEKCCICNNDNCNENHQKCLDQGKRAKETFKVYPNNLPVKRPVLKTKNPITTTIKKTTTLKTTFESKMTTINGEFF
jgi:hypothetical protein